MTDSSDQIISLQEADVLQSVEAQLAEVVPELAGRPLSLDDSLRDLGCNSVDRADIASLTIESFAVDIPVQELAAVDDIGSLVSLVLRYVNR